MNTTEQPADGGAVTPTPATPAISTGSSGEVESVRDAALALVVRSRLSLATEVIKLRRALAASSTSGLTDGGALAHVAAERRRQIGKGWTPDHDDGHSDGEIAIQAGYLLNGWNIRHPRTHERTWVDPHRHNRRERLVIAAALLVAEIDRLDRAATDTNERGRTNGR